MSPAALRPRMKSCHRNCGSQKGDASATAATTARRRGAADRAAHLRQAEGTTASAHQALQQHDGMAADLQEQQDRGRAFGSGREGGVHYPGDRQ